MENQSGDGRGSVGYEEPRKGEKSTICISIILLFLFLAHALPLSYAMYVQTAFELFLS